MSNVFSLIIIVIFIRVFRIDRIDDIRVDIGI